MAKFERMLTYDEIKNLAIEQLKGFDKPSSKIWNDAITSFLYAIKKECEYGEI